MPTVEIKQFTDWDTKVARDKLVEEIDAINKEIPIDSTDMKTWQAYNRFVFNPSRRLFVAMHNDQVIGYAQVQEQFKGYNLNYIAVKKEFRSQGVGRDLILSIFKANINALSLHVRHTNEKTISFYESLRKDLSVTKKEGYAYIYSNGDQALEYELSRLPDVSSSSSIE